MKGTIRVIGAVLLFLSATGFTWSQTFTKLPSLFNPVLSDQSSGYSGAAWVDVDGDGNLDLFVNQGFLYRGNGSGVFAKVTTSIGTGIAAATGNGVTWGDYDNDGDLDAFIASRNSVLYRNNGSGVFSVVTTGDIGQILANRGWSPAWGDFNADGNLDLAITHPAGFVPGGSTPNHLFIGDGPPDYGFTRVTTGPIVTGLTSYTVGSWSDFDDDGDLDYFIGAGPANGSTQPDFLYRNRLAETGTADFEQIGDAPIGTEPQDGQLWNWIDYDNDGDLDVYVTNWAGGVGGLENRLYRNDGDSFTKITTGAIVTDSDTSLSSVWADFDNDGDLDCFVANDSNQTDRYYANNGDGSFTSLSNTVTESVTHRGAAAGDWDQRDEQRQSLAQDPADRGRIESLRDRRQGPGHRGHRRLDRRADARGLGAEHVQRAQQPDRALRAAGCDRREQPGRRVAVGQRADADRRGGRPVAGRDRGHDDTGCSRRSGRTGNAAQGRQERSRRAGHVGCFDLSAAGRQHLSRRDRRFLELQRGKLRSSAERNGERADSRQRVVRGRGNQRHRDRRQLRGRLVGRGASDRRGGVGLPGDHRARRQRQLSLKLAGTAPGDAEPVSVSYRLGPYG
jgi:hypothetical protein